ncbi:MurR/RpiR family transcriptional regulator [Paenibacillus chartarius]|uniref:MurR/RpiR family transcriptional regulator n=1 Tax=Paenibacillus chartarius TaxID=747481 RepID=A0ABV6DN96_9BACL
MNGGLVRLKELYQDLKPSEQIAASYILQHPERMLGLSIAQLADESGSSQAAIVRLCKSMGVKGYQDLKLKVAGDLQQGQSGRSGAGYLEIRSGESVENIIECVSGNNVQSILDTVKVLDAAVVAQAIAALDKARRIFFYGIGASNLIAMDAQQKFLRISKTALSFADPHVQLTASVSLGAGDVAVGISYSGETKPVIAALRSAREQGAETISITKYGNTTLSTYADYPLFISSTEHEIRSGAMASRISQLNVIDILYLGVASRDYDQSVQHLERSRRAIKETEH